MNLKSLLVFGNDKDDKDVDDDVQENDVKNAE